MTAAEAWQLVASGWIILIGEVRGINVGLAGYVDKKTGLSAQSLVATYFVERIGPGGFEIVKITQRAPMGVNDPAQFVTGVEKGRHYAFAIEGLERKPGFLTARMGSTLPQLMDTEEGRAPAPMAQAPCP